MSVSKFTGLFICFNTDCGARGTIEHMFRRLTDMTEFQMLRILDKHSVEYDFKQVFSEAQAEFEWPKYPAKNIESLHKAYLQAPRPNDYMRGRGFTESTIRRFKVGYSARQQMVTVPVKNPAGEYVGVVGRSIEGKSFKNSKALPRNRTMFNYSDVSGDTVIVTESAFDTMMLWQRGYPNAVGILGGAVSDIHIQLLNKFSEIYLFVDNDKVGSKIADRIAAEADGVCLHPRYDCDTMYPEGAKDVCDLNPKQTKTMLENAITNIERVIQQGENNGIGTRTG